LHSQNGEKGIESGDVSVRGTRKVQVFSAYRKISRQLLRRSLKEGKQKETSSRI
jgi:hypothetical protein